MERLFENKLAVFGMFMLCLMVLLALIAPSFIADAPDSIDLENSLQSGTPEHPLGCDQLGRDLLSRVVHGARISLGIGFIVTLISLSIGTFLGVVAGYSKGLLDLVFVWIFDTFLAIPGLLLAIGIVAVLGPSYVNLIIAMSVMGWVGYARLARGLTIKVKSAEYVTAAQISGVSILRVLLRHILPNIAGPLIVQASLGMAGVIVVESTLSFLGLAGDIDVASWGAMLNDGMGYILIAPHLIITPSVAIGLTVLSLNFLGDGLRDALDPRNEAIK